MTSLKQQLIVWLLGLLSVVGVLAGGVSFYLALQETNRLLDHELSEIARSVDEGSQFPAMQATFRTESEQEKKGDFVIQVWIGRQPCRSSRPGFDLPRNGSPGFSDVMWHGSKWRVYTMLHRDRTVQVSQADGIRFEMAIDSAARALLPVVALIPLSWLVVGVVVSRILRPLESVTAAAARRDALSLEPLPTKSVPKEVFPLIRAMNDLISRLCTALAAQRQFLSDAAHELRTPLSALELQIENLSRHDTREDLDNRIEEMRRGSRRASHLVRQLLKLSRYEAQAKPAVRSSVDLGAVVKACIADFVPLAGHRDIDLGMVRDDAATIRANADDLRTLIGNLIDNAVRYTPRGGKVDISVTASAGEARVSILDDGPGIAESALPRVFDRFFRAANNETEGSGIGLAIVKLIAEREAAEIAIANRRDGHGLIATVAFSLAT